MSIARHEPIWATVEVDSWETLDDEPLGTKDKSWLLDPEGTRWLFKFCRDGGGRVRGEDWAEWIVHRLAALIHVPSAEIRPAVCRGRRGLLSRSLVKNDGQLVLDRLVHGNELLAAKDPGYDMETTGENLGYTVAAVRCALDGIRSTDPSMGAFEMWAGYVTLDAWVAGRDRHHENWAVIEGPEGRRLAPSFDHGNALGFQESEERTALLARDSERLLGWANRGVSRHFSGRPSLIDVAREALTAAGPTTAHIWTQRLSEVADDQVEQIVRAVPESLLSVSNASFCMKLLELNRRRLKDDDH